MSEEFDLFDVLERPTVETAEKSLIADSVDVSHELEFSEVEDTGLGFDLTEQIEEEGDREIIEPYNAAAQMDTLIALISTINVMAITPLALWKLNKSFGGKKKVKELTAAYEKSLFSREELTETDKTKVVEFQRYLKVKAQLEDDIPFSEDEMNNLRTAGLPYFQNSQIKVEGGFAFYTILASLIGARIINVATL